MRVTQDHRRIRAVGAVLHRSTDVDPIAGTHAGDTVTQLVNDARGIGARRVRQFGRDGIAARAHVGVVGIDAGRMHAHANFSGTGPRIGLFGKGEDFRSSEFASDDGKHGRSIAGGGVDAICIVRWTA